MFVSLGLTLHRLTGVLCVFLLAGLAASEIAIVLLRYIYGIGFLQLQDFASYCFAALVILGIPYALGRDAHVRVDVFREKQTPATRRSVDFAGVVLLLIPVFSLLLYHVWPDIRYAWEIKEGSKETGGLPGLYLVKTCLPVTAVLMLLQGATILLRKGEYVATRSST
mgnify:CR=1 FL=1